MQARERGDPTRADGTRWQRARKRRAEIGQRGPYVSLRERRDEQAVAVGGQPESQGGVAATLGQPVTVGGQVHVEPVVRRRFLQTDAGGGGEHLRVRPRDEPVLLESAAGFVGDRVLDQPAEHQRTQDDFQLPRNGPLAKSVGKLGA